MLPEGSLGQKLPRTLKKMVHELHELVHGLHGLARINTELLKIFILKKQYNTMIRENSRLALDRSIIRGLIKIKNTRLVYLVA